MWRPVAAEVRSMQKKLNVVIGLIALLIASGASADDEAALCPVRRRQ